MSFLGALLSSGFFFLYNWCCTIAFVLTWSHTYHGTVVQPIINHFSCLRHSHSYEDKGLNKGKCRLQLVLRHCNHWELERSQRTKKKAWLPGEPSPNLAGSHAYPFPVLFFQITVSDLSSWSLSLAMGPWVSWWIFLRKLLTGKPLKIKKREVSQIVPWTEQHLNLYGLSFISASYMKFLELCLKIKQQREVA